MSIALIPLPRELSGHESNDANKAISIHADERDPKNGSTSHLYKLQFVDKRGDFRNTELRFQHGPIKEVGVNGVTNEALMAILIDRLEGFQSGPYACDENELTLVHLRKALEAQMERTRKRVERGVEGTHEV